MANELLDYKNAQIEALQKDRQKNINYLKQLIAYVENPQNSKDDQSPHFLSEGEMLDIIVDQLKKLTTIRHRLEGKKLKELGLKIGHL
jgi:hypothetical protein